MRGSRSLQGHFVSVTTVGDQVEAFVPKSLPPNPDIAWDAELRHKFDQAHVALGRLDSVTLLLPDATLFLYTYVRKEAVLSSMIEGTQSSLSDLLLYEIDEEPGVPYDDVVEVSNYVAALQEGLSQLERLPLSSRLIRKIHTVLLSKGRGKSQSPGHFRQSQVWIGGTRPGNATFIPPPAHLVPDLMSGLEKYLHDESQHTSPLLKAALVHHQFETIHPFLDGNGRLGRLLITLLLVEEKVLRQPLLYLSFYFKKHRSYYYELLNRVRMDGDWEAWLDFFAEAVTVTANQAVDTVQRLVALTNDDREKIKGLGRVASSTLRVHRELMKHPISSAKRLAKNTDLAIATVNNMLNKLEKLGIVQELTDKKRNRLFSYAAYINILNEGTELPTD